MPFQCAPKVIDLADGITGEFVFGPFLPGQWVVELACGVTAGATSLALVVLVGTERSTPFAGQSWLDDGAALFLVPGQAQVIPLNLLADESRRFVACRLTPTGNAVAGWLSVVCSGEGHREDKPARPPRSRRVAGQASLPSIGVR